MFIVLLVLLAVLQLTTAAEPKVTTGMVRYRTFTFPPTPKISEDELVIKDFSTFVHNHSLDAPNANKSALRLWPRYIDKTDTAQVFNIKLFGMMKQALYSAQDRLKYLERILAKYEEDLSFRAGYIFTKLDQMLHDMKRIYSYALKKFDWRRVVHHISFYKHMTKKNIDITYIVEYMFSFHGRNLRNLEMIFNEANKNDNQLIIS